MMRLTLAGILIACAAVDTKAASAVPRPALVVALSVDQLSAGLFDQYRGRFSGGLRRLVDEGVVFPNGYQSHAATETCPGHSTLLTGRHPAGTGIIGNQWYAATDTPEGKRELKKQYCVWDPGSPVPGRPKDPRGPRNLRVTTLGEWMHRADRNSRTVAVSGKDRAAITMAGHDPTAVYWWDNDRGFNTYVPTGATEEGRLEPVKAFNDALAARWASQRPEWRVAESACGALAGPERYGALVLDHVVPPPLVRAGQEGPLRQDEGFVRWLRASPILDELTLDLASRLVDRFALGRRSATDLLAVSLSATDYIGHTYGNQGPEMCDQLAHLDLALGKFLDRLDALRVPYVVVLSADHGALDAAERVAERGVHARRVAPDLAADANRALREQADLHLDFDPLVREGDAFYLDRLKTDEPRRALVAKAARTFLASRQEVAAVFTKEEALATRVPAGKAPDELTLLERVAESIDAERSGDLLVALQPYTSVGMPRKRGDNVAGHGSPWNYDRRVPILFWRSGGGHFEQSLPIETVDIAPTLASLLGLHMPDGIPLDGVCRDLDAGPGSTCGP
jgi:predicted AlkP superfamily pyrophosphatase or phosphodiesterase